MYVLVFSTYFLCYLVISNFKVLRSCRVSSCGRSRRSSESGNRTYPCTVILVWLILVWGWIVLQVSITQCATRQNLLHRRCRIAFLMLFSDVRIWSNLVEVMALSTKLDLLEASWLSEIGFFDELGRLFEHTMYFKGVSAAQLIVLLITWRSLAHFLLTACFPQKTLKLSLLIILLRCAFLNHHLLKYDHLILGFL